MTDYLFALSIGPVQDFIASARRTRDLWFGSFILSEISKAAARTLAESGCELIFPALNNGDAELEPAKNKNPEEAFNVANVIIVKIPKGLKLNPDEINLKAINSATDTWKKFAKEAADQLRTDSINYFDEDIWENQIKDVIECYSAWTPLTEKYSESRRRLMRLLAGRKSIRNFSQPKGKSKGLPKSSLDGARDSVIHNKKIPKNLKTKMRLSEGEELCAVGLTKRLGGADISFPSVIRVALDPWIRGVYNRVNGAEQILSKIGESCKNGPNFSSGTGKRIYQNFPYDGRVCYPPQLKGMIDEYRKNPSLSSLNPEDIDRLENIKRYLETPTKQIGEPDPYLAVLVADGDRMGKIISSIDSAEEHRKFSKKLSEFSDNARSIVERKNNGCLVYSGGDDVLAFLPVDRCLNAARMLHDNFGELLKNYSGGIKPTLSVGIAIGHTRETLEDLLEFARAAEKDAKGYNRNGLAIHLHTRSGGEPIRIREQWSDTNGPDKRMIKWTDMYLRDSISDRAAYELRDLAKGYLCWSSQPDINLLKSDAKRLFMRKRIHGGSKKIAEEDIAQLINGIDSAEKLMQRAEELIIARRLSIADKISGEKNGVQT